MHANKNCYKSTLHSLCVFALTSIVVQNSIKCNMHNEMPVVFFSL